MDNKLNFATNILQLHRVMALAETITDIEQRKRIGDALDAMEAKRLELLEILPEARAKEIYGEANFAAATKQADVVMTDLLVKQIVELQADIEKEIANV